MNYGSNVCGKHLSVHPICKSTESVKISALWSKWLNNIDVKYTEPFYCKSYDHEHYLSHQTRGVLLAPEIGYNLFLLSRFFVILVIFLNFYNWLGFMLKSSPPFLKFSSVSILWCAFAKNIFTSVFSSIFIRLSGFWLLHGLVAINVWTNQMCV